MNARRKTDRRDFLTGVSAAEALADLAAGPPPPPGGVPASSAASAISNAADAPPTSNAAAVSPPTYLMEFGRTAMACEFQVFLNAGQHRIGPDAALQALDLIDQLEDQLTVYRAQSEVSRLNQTAHACPRPVEPRLFALFQQAVRLHAETEGAFDITAGPLSKTWGFYRRAGRFPDPAEIAAALRVVGADLLKLDAAAGTLQFERAGMEINLGAIGKGYALDRCGELLLDAGVANFIVHGGMSSILARGSRSGLPEPRRGWSVALRHPLRHEQRLAEIWLDDRALGTSGSGVQFFYHQGRRYGHVLDPRTGRPAEGVLSTTVLAPTAAVADALATAFYVLGLEKTSAYCAAHPEIGVLLVAAGRRAGSIELHPINLDDVDWSADAA